MVCHSYLSRFYSYVTRMYLLVSVCRWYVTRISLVFIRMLLVCICLCPYVGGMSLVSLSFVSVYHSYVSACAVCRWYVTRRYLSRFYSYVTRVYLLVSVCRWYVTRISLVFIRMSLVCIRISLVCICLCRL